MKQIFFLAITIGFCSCGISNITYYIVRHAEKAVVDSTVKLSDVPLSEQGAKRAGQLKTKLENKNVKYIFSTNTVRTKATAEPLSITINVPIQIYNGTDTGFVQKLKHLNENVLVVGHSNTVDDLVNGLLGKPVLKDLTESQFGDLFIVHKKKNKFTYEGGRY